MGLYSLERRRERYTVFYTAKIMNGLGPNFRIATYNKPQTGQHSTKDFICSRKSNNIIMWKSKGHCILMPFHRTSGFCVV